MMAIIIGDKKITGTVKKNDGNTKKTTTTAPSSNSNKTDNKPKDDYDSITLKKQATKPANLSLETLKQKVQFVGDKINTKATGINNYINNPIPKSYSMFIELQLLTHKQLEPSAEYENSDKLPDKIKNQQICYSKIEKIPFTFVNNFSLEDVGFIKGNLSVSGEIYELEKALMNMMMAYHLYTAKGSELENYGALIPQMKLRFGINNVVSANEDNFYAMKENEWLYLTVLGGLPKITYNDYGLNASFDFLETSSAIADSIHFEFSNNYSDYGRFKGRADFASILKEVFLYDGDKKTIKNINNEEVSLAIDKQGFSKLKEKIANDYNIKYFLYEPETNNNYLNDLYMACWKISNKNYYKSLYFDFEKGEKEKLITNFSIQENYLNEKINQDIKEIEKDNAKLKENEKIHIDKELIREKYNKLNNFLNYVLDNLPKNKYKIQSNDDKTIIQTAKWQTITVKIANDTQRDFYNKYFNNNVKTGDTLIIIKNSKDVLPEPEKSVVLGYKYGNTPNPIVKEISFDLSNLLYQFANFKVKKEGENFYVDNNKQTQITNTENGFATYVSLDTENTSYFLQGNLSIVGSFFWLTGVKNLHYKLGEEIIYIEVTNKENQKLLTTGFYCVMGAVHSFSATEWNVTLKVMSYIPLKESIKEAL